MARCGAPSSSRDTTWIRRPPTPPRALASSTASRIPWWIAVPCTASAPVRGLISPIVSGAAARAGGALSASAGSANATTRRRMAGLREGFFGLRVEEVHALGNERNPDLLVHLHPLARIHPNDDHVLAHLQVEQDLGPERFHDVDDRFAGPLR